MLEKLPLEHYYNKTMDYLRLGSQGQVTSLVVEGSLGEGSTREFFRIEQLVGLFKEKTNGKEIDFFVASGFRSDEDFIHGLKRIDLIDIKDKIPLWQETNPDINTENLSKKQEAEEFLRRNNYPIAVLGFGRHGITGRLMSMIFYHPGLPISEALSSLQLAARRRLGT